MDNKLFEQNPYKKTVESNTDVVSTLPTYAEIMQCFGGGDNEVELKKRYMLKKLDETWISVIEDTLPALDQIIRNPQQRLEVVEEILPVQISKNINGRSIIHLCQNTNNISEVKDDGMVIPTKLLNVLQEDTVLTYENKFINTLVNRLYAFIAIRYNGAKECGEDNKNTSIKFSQKFEHGEYSGKINVSLEIDQKPEEHEVIKNYIYTSDLWKRLEKVYTVVQEYMASPFIKNMGKNFVRSPVLRTNTILKNPLFKDCLSLWEFIESYENTGYETLVQEDLLTVNEKLIQDMYQTIAEQYVIFQTHIRNGFDEETKLDTRLLNIRPNIKDEFDDLNEDEFDYRTLVPGILKNDGSIEYPDEDIEIAILVALAADAMMWEDEIDEEEQVVIDEKGEIVYKYKYSFLGRLIKAQNPTQDYYTEIKNELLSYNGVKNFLSWSRELFKNGRNPICKLNCKGKTLFVYLALDPNEFDKDHYHHLDVSKEGKKNEYPFLLKVRSHRACKYAIELIGIIMYRLGLIKNEAYEMQDFHIGPMSIEEMLEKDYARLIDGKAPEKKKEEPVIDENDANINYMYKFSYSARLIRSGDEKQDLYNELKNYILSYKKVTSKISWGHELFKNGRNKISIFKVKGKTLCVYLPLNPDNYDQDRLHYKDMRVEGKEVEMPLMMKITSKLAVKHACELIDEVMKMFGLVRDENYAIQDYKLPYMSLEEMLTSDPVLAKRIDGYVPPKPEKVDESSNDEEVIVKDGITYRYKFSYSARLIRSGDERQNLYNDLKNGILAYKKVTSKISWGHELFKNGRNKIALFKVRGKTLCVYLPLNPDNYDQDRLHYKDMRVEGKEVEFPMMLKITSGLAVRHCLELIKDIMDGLGLVLDDNYVVQDYRLPYMSLNEMLTCDPVLAKLVKGAEMPAPEAKPVEPEAEETEEEVVVKDGIVYRYKFSYSARLIRSGDERQELYNQIKNFALSYNKVTSKISWGHELFKNGRNKISVFKVRGKTLCVYLPLNPDNYDQDRLHFKDMRVEGKEVEFPMMLKITSGLAARHACELIADVMNSFGLNKKDDYEPVDYKLAYMSIADMLSCDPVLAKLVKGAEMPAPEAKPVEPVVEVVPEVLNEEVETEEDEEVEENGIKYRYKFSYTARMIRSGEERQALYNLIKNDILSFKKVTSKISWGHELFKLGRNKISKFKVRGKTLCVYLPLNPDNYDQDRLHFKDMRVEGKEVEFPMMLKITSGLAARRACDLIKDIMSNLNIPHNDEYISNNYRFKHMSINQMLNSEPPLAKLVEKTVVIEPVIDGLNTIEYKYKFSFKARMILSGEERQDLYNQVKNEFLAYKKVTSRISWSHESVKFGRIKLGQLKVRGKTLCVYLPLNPDKYDANRYHFKDMRYEGKEVPFPMLMKVKSNRAVNHLRELIADVMSLYGIPKRDTYPYINFTFKSMSIKEMLECEPKLIKETIKKDVLISSLVKDVEVLNSDSIQTNSEEQNIEPKELEPVIENSIEDNMVPLEASIEEPVNEQTEDPSKNERHDESPSVEEIAEDLGIDKDTGESIESKEEQPKKKSFFDRLFRRNK